MYMNMSSTVVTETVTAAAEFLITVNPRGNHSSSLCSEARLPYLFKCLINAAFEG